MINKIRLVKTCDEYPEQYEAYLGKKHVGYLRLRNGWFRVDYPDCGDETIYEAYPIGDGSFTNEERKHYLDEAKKHILAKIRLEDAL